MRWRERRRGEGGEGGGKQNMGAIATLGDDKGNDIGVMGRARLN